MFTTERKGDDGFMYRKKRTVVLTAAVTVTVSAVLFAAGAAGVGVESVNAQQQVFNEEINKTFGGSDADFANSMIETSDGGFAIAGLTESSGAGSFDAWLIKTDSEGNVEFSKTYGGAGSDGAGSVAETSDGGFVLAGETESFGGPDDDAWLIKTDENGTEQFNKTFGGGDTDEANSVVETSAETADRGFVLAGRTFSFGAGNSAAWLIKTDENGNVEFNETFGGAGFDGANSVVETSDGFALAGYTRSFSTGGSFDEDAWLIKTNESGKEQFNVTFGGTNDDGANSVVETSNGGFALGAETRSFGAGSKDAWLIRADANGNEQFNETYGGGKFDEASSVVETSDGFALVGEEASFGGPDDDAWMIRTDENGNVEFNETFGGGNPDGADSVVEMSDGFALAGDTESFGAGDDDAWLIKGKTETEITSCADDVTSSGRYTVAEDISNPATSACINVTASDVIIEGNENTIGGVDGDPASVGINVSSSSVLDGIAVRNLTVTGWGEGVRYDGVSGGGIAEVNASRNSLGISLNSSTDVEVLENEANKNGDGIRLRSSSGIRVTANNATENDVNGIVLGEKQDGGITPLASSDNNEVTDNNASNNGEDGIVLRSSSDNNEVTGNNASDNDENGIVLQSSSGNEVTENEARSNGGGIVLEEKDDDDGIFLASSDNNEVTANDAIGNDAQGILVTFSSGNNVTANNVSGNGFGIELDNANGNELTANEASGNDGDGIDVTASSSNSLTANTARENGDDGIDVTTSSGNDFVNNTARDNAGSDVEVDSPDNTFEELDIGASTAPETTLDFTGNNFRLNGTGSPSPDPSGEQNIGRFVEATNTSMSGSFLNVTFEYTDSDVSNVNESTLSVWKNNGSWTELGAGPATDPAQNRIQFNVTNAGSVFAPLADGDGGPLFTQPLIDSFGAPPTNTQEFNNTLYEDLDGDGSGKDVTQTVRVFGELIRGNPLNGDAPDGSLTDAQARALNWNQGSPETEVTPADMVSLFGRQIRAG